MLTIKMLGLLIGVAISWTINRVTNLRSSARSVVAISEAQWCWDLDEAFDDVERKSGNPTDDTCHAASYETSSHSPTVRERPVRSVHTKPSASL